MSSVLTALVRTIVAPCTDSSRQPWLSLTRSSAHRSTYEQTTGRLFEAKTREERT
jgi:hypothetical protein